MNSTRNRFLRRPATTSSSRIPGRILICLVIIAAAVTSAGWYVAARNSADYTVVFRNSAGLYEGDEVVVLGVPVGTVNTITPYPDGVHVKISVTGQRIPKEARAVIVAPTLVTGRYVQLTPAYATGPELAAGATIPAERTATPVEFDEVKQQLVALADDLGPTMSSGGSLNRFLANTSRTVAGNGAVLHRALVQLSSATDTLNHGGQDLFGTIEHLQKFVSAVSSADNEIEAFSGQLAQFSGVLHDNRAQTAQLLVSLATAFDEVKRFVDDNRKALVDDVNAATKVSGLLVDRVDTLSEILHAGPTAVSDFYNIYDPVGNSLTAALGIPDIPDPESLICALLTTVDAPEGECVKARRHLAENMVAAAASSKGGRR